MVKFLKLLVHGAPSSPFRINCEEISASKIEFLELVIWKGPEDFQYAPRFKHTALKVPKLHAESEHWRSIHKSWPLAYLKKKLLIFDTDCKDFTGR